MLVNSTEVLHNNKKYLLSIAICILAEEEISKLDFLRDHYKKKNPVLFREWKQIRDHKEKLTTPFIEGLEAVKNMSKEQYETAIAVRKSQGGDNLIPYDELIKLGDSFDIKNLEKFDIVKQDGFYATFRDNNWFSILTDIPIKQQEAISFTKMLALKLAYYDLLLSFQFDLINDSTFAELQNNELTKKMIEINKVKKSNAFQTKAILASSALKKFYKIK